MEVIASTSPYTTTTNTNRVQVWVTHSNSGSV
jgi:hypothetical protein